ANRCRPTQQRQNGNIIDEPVDPFIACGNRHDALGTEAQLLPGGPVDTCPPMHVLECDGCGTELAPGCSDSGEADSRFGGTSEEGGQCRVLIDPIVSPAGEVAKFLFGRL